MEPDTDICIYVIVILSMLGTTPLAQLPSPIRKWIHFPVGKAFSCECLRENTLKHIVFVVNEIPITLANAVLYYQTHNSQGLPLIQGSWSVSAWVVSHGVFPNT